MISNRRPDSSRSTLATSRPCPAPYAGQRRHSQVLKFYDVRVGRIGERGASLATCCKRGYKYFNICITHGIAIKQATIGIGRYTVCMLYRYTYTTRIEVRFERLVCTPTVTAGKVQTIL